MKFDGAVYVGSISPHTPVNHSVFSPYCSNAMPTPVVASELRAGTFTFFSDDGVPYVTSYDVGDAPSAHDPFSTMNTSRYPKD